jgi:hypothetical protein
MGEAKPNLTKLGAELLLDRINTNRASHNLAALDVSADDIVRMLGSDALSEDESERIIREVQKDEALRAAGEQFRAYEAHHRAKGGEADEKAERNRQMAEMCEAALGPADAERIGVGTTTLDMWRKRAQEAEKKAGDAALYEDAILTVRELLGEDGKIAFIDDAVKAALARRDAEIERLRTLLGSPELHDFSLGVVNEAAHQRERWGATHDAGKGPEDWFWLLGYLGGKALRAAMQGDAEKALHHTISTAAACANWHAQLLGASNTMRPGIGPGNKVFEAEQAAAAGVPEDDGCPKGDPDCLGNNGDCHDACSSFAERDRA